MRLAPKLYRLARDVNNFEALVSGKPIRVVRRTKNIFLGRLLSRFGFWSIWK